MTVRTIHRFLLLQSDSLKTRRSVSPKKHSTERKTATPEPGASGAGAGATASSGSSASSSRRRKGSMAFVSSEKIAKLLRRTHSAGCSKDVPSYALFLSEKHEKHEKHDKPSVSITRISIQWIIFCSIVSIKKINPFVLHSMGKTE